MILLKIVLIVVLLLIVLTSYLLVSPLKFILDSRGHIAWIGWNRWLNAKWNDEDRGVQLTLPFWQKNIAWMNLIPAGKPAGKNNNQKSNKRKVPAFMSWKRFRRGLNIDDFMLNIDTDDFILNAYLYPVLDTWKRVIKYKVLLDSK